MNSQNLLLLSVACGGAAATLALLKGGIGPAADVELLKVTSVSEPSAPPAETYQYAERPPSGSQRAQRLSPMQDALTRMSEMQRNQLLRLAIRDSGFRCDDVISASSIGNEVRAWRASCVDASRYLVIVDDLEQLAVQPIAWDDAVF
jgi:hypothetical protein